MRTSTRMFLPVLFAFALAMPGRAQTCPSDALATPKKSALYVYMPTAVDNTFPSYGGQPTSPLNPFDMALHDPSLSTAAVRQRALELMQAAYCEFDVNVKLATAAPAPPEPRWQIVGVGSDSSFGPVGKAQAVDTGDAVSQDFARVWANDLQTFCGGELAGANSTVERWATAVANLVAHESGHNYGALHSESAPKAGEDPAGNHFIADPQTGATPATISDRLNHHSDTVYERFGHDIGLTFYTLHNWDFVNPNNSDADSLTIRVLSKAATLTIGWYYAGIDNPWGKPTVAKQPGTLPFEGDNWNIFDVSFSTPKAWNGGANGVVPAGAKFHVGASFIEQNGIVINETTLLSGGMELVLKPRQFGYDAGTNGGNFELKFYNPGGADLVLSDLQVLFLPRMIDIEQMRVGGVLRGVDGEPVIPFQRVSADRNDRLPDRLTRPERIGKKPFVMTIAKLTDRRHLDRIIQRGECEGGGTRAGGTGFGDPSVIYCPTPGNVLSLFPATYTYVMATVTDPNAHYWDKTLGHFVDGPLSTRLFFQLAGNVPDANRNGRDDLIDIRDGTSRDRNNNGIPDEAEKTTRR